MDRNAPDALMDGSMGVNAFTLATSLTALQSRATAAALPSESFLQAPPSLLFPPARFLLLPGTLRSRKRGGLRSSLVAQPLCTMTSLCLLYVWTAAVSMYFMSAGEFDPSTGTFVYAGGDCSEIDKADVEAILRARDPGAAFPMAPAHGLYLAWVHYDGTRTWNAGEGGGEASGSGGEESDPDAGGE